MICMNIYIWFVCLFVYIQKTLHSIYMDDIYVYIYLVCLSLCLYPKTLHSIYMDDIYVYIYLVCLSLCLYPKKHFIAAQPICLNFLVATHVTPGKI